jgi:predicted N-formylglutamate amidohydrolase
MSLPLLAADEPHPVLASRRGGRSAFVIVVDHASRRIPKRLATLGLAQSDLERHIAWDIGALAVAQSVSAALDAPLVAQNYSRLVIDCNRRPGDPTSIPTISESTLIPGNLDLPAEQVSARQREIFEPYHQHLSALLEERAAAGRDRRFADCLLEALRSERELVVGDNEPYSGKQEIGYTLPHHGERRGIPHLEVEIRQDLVQLPSGQAEWSRRMTAALLAADQAFVRKSS